MSSGGKSRPIGCGNLNGSGKIPTGSPSRFGDRFMREWRSKFYFSND
jgi:hypothetical protein